MAQESFKRKLTAMLSADVVGYSPLMDDNEEATIRTLNTYRASMTTLIQQYIGRVVDTTGDNLLAEFTSAVDAVTCAVEIQRELVERNTELPHDSESEFGIGINVGDVVESGRIMMDGTSEVLRQNPDIRDFYLGLTDTGGRKSFCDVKHYKQRKRWLT